MNRCDNCFKLTKKNKQKGCNHLFCDMKCRDEFRNKAIPIYQCDNCKKYVKKQRSGKFIFCDLKCKRAFNLKKYSHLEHSFNENQDETAFLFGLILGDGHLKKSGKQTTRISIAFNAKDERAISIAQIILTKLEIVYYIEPKVHQNCLTLGFILPNDLLEKYNMLFTGNKYKAQPSCHTDIVKNINFATGLLNSDGCFVRTKRRYLTFSNTVQSIIKIMQQCLSINEIKHKTYSYIYKQTSWKPRQDIHITGKQNIDKIILSKYSKWNTQ